MRIDEFTKAEQTNTCVIAVPNYDVAQQILTFYAKQGYEQLFLADLFGNSDTFLHMPDALFQKLTGFIDNQFEQSGKNGFVITGTFAYLLLLSDQQRKLAFAELKSIIDHCQEKYQLSFLLSTLWQNELCQCFDHPRYMSAGEVIFFEGELKTKNVEIFLIGKEWDEDQPPVCKNFKEFIERIGKFPNDTDETIKIALLGDKTIAGLNQNIRQIHTLAEYMRVFHGIDETLPESTLSWILQNQSYTVNADTKNVLKRFMSIHDNDEKRTFLLYLRKGISQNSYLYNVLCSNDLTSENFLQIYAVENAVANLSNKAFAEERKHALSGLQNRDSLIAQFIERVKDKSLDEILLWFSDSKTEHTELLRRGAKYPAVEAYLSNYDYGNETLTNYFRQYRVLKLSNTITETFCRLACDVSDNVETRNSLLTPFNKCEKTTLLVVDAMGAEYLPLIVSQAPQHGLKIESHHVAKVSLPTSTQFNKIDFQPQLPGIKALDSIVHYGARKNEQTKYCENIAEVLDVVFPQIFGRIAENIDKHDRIILTADHGASRLAVIANENGLTQTLENPTSTPPDDWRYTRTENGSNVTKYQNNLFYETIEGDYLCVRGYNRLPKQGGRQYELHGGYTPEEVFVPFVVFSRFAISKPVTQIPMNKSQIREKDDFDI